MTDTPLPQQAPEILPEVLLDADEVALHAGVVRATVWRWAREGKLPAVRRNSRVVRFRRADVEAFLSREREAS